MQLLLSLCGRNGMEAMKKANGGTLARNGYSGCWPNKTQELLLQACLLPITAARDAWNQWKTTVDLDHVDPGSNRLFPLLFHNLHSYVTEDPLLKIFEWVYLVNRQKGQKINQDMAALLRAFHDAGIQTMVLKGVALSILHYKDCGLRPMGDFDVLVPTKQVRTSIMVLDRHGWMPIETALKGFSQRDRLNRFGWVPGPRPLDSFTDTYFAARHAHEFLDAEGHVCDLHWHLLHGCNHVTVDEVFWNQALAVDFHGVPTHALNPTDQLFHACIYGVKWDGIPPIRWVADAATIIHNPDHHINWDRLVYLARITQSALPVRAALEYLRRVLNITVPSHVFLELKNLPVSSQKKIEYRIRTRPPRVLDGLLELYLVSQCCFRGMKNQQLIRKLCLLPRLVLHVFGMEHISQLPLYAAFELIRRMNEILMKERGNR